MKISKGAGAFVCGEETALIASMEGNIGEPRPRPPYPGPAGLWGKPTVINNVETWANVPARSSTTAPTGIAAIGTENSKGTKVFSLVGAVNNTGLVEVPMGTTLRQMVYDLGGGIRGGGEFKAVQTGGPSGGCIPKQFLDLPVDYDSLQSGGLHHGLRRHDRHGRGPAAWWTWPATSWASSTTNPAASAPPAGKAPSTCWRSSPTSPKGKANRKTLALMEELCDTMTAASLCGLGQSAVNPVLSTLKYFREEYEAHILHKKCPALVCRPLLKYTIDPETCTGCLACVRECPADAIHGEAGEPQELDQELCVKCGMCHAVCKFDAVKVES